MNTIKNLAKVTLPAILFLIIGGACNQASTQPPIYGTKIQYDQGQPLSFPDVTLEFVGKREAPLSDNYPQGITFYDFKVYQGNQAQLVSWSAGTGDIGPTLFELSGNKFVLELAMSDTLGSLDVDELVLWQEVIPTAEVLTATPTPTPTLPTPTPLPPIEFTLDRPFTLSLNQYGRLQSSELGIELYQIEDYRCPQQEICESEGEADISIFVWKTNIEPVEFGLSTDPAANRSMVPYDEYQIQLLTLEPYPETSEGIAPQDYRATFVVSK